MNIDSLIINYYYYHYYYYYIICRLVVTLKTVLIVDRWYRLHFREGVIKMVDVLTFRLLSRSLWKKNHVSILYTLLGKCGAFYVDMLFNRLRVYRISPIDKSSSLPCRHSKRLVTRSPGRNAWRTSKNVCEGGYKSS